MKTQKINPFFKDKKITITGFGHRELNRRIFEIENRCLWREMIIRQIHCEECGNADRLAFHIRDIPKLIKALQYLLELQEELVGL